MNMNVKETNQNITCIELSGRLDILGVNQIETKFAAYCSGENARVIVDLTHVEYLASIGIRLLVTNAKSLLSRSGKMVLLRPNPAVMEVLEMTNIPSIIPVFAQVEAAEAALLG